ncbi:MAG: CBS domain-containing protein [Planctomycetota bacterium]
MIRKAADLMQKDVITASPGMSLRDLALLMEEEGIHGLPVVDSAGYPIGVVSRSDLVSSITSETDQLTPNRQYYAVADEEIDLDEGYSPPDLSVDGDKTVGDIMSTHIVKAGINATAGELGALMSRERVHRVLITEGPRLVGIVSSTDVLKCLADYEKILKSSSKR